MQQIERYGIIALLFLVVSIVVVALWDPDPGTALGNDRGRTASVDTWTSRELPLAQPGAKNKAKAWTEQRPRQNQANNNASSAAAARAERTRLASHKPSAPLDLGSPVKNRNRGRNAGAAARSAQVTPPVGNESKLVNPGPSRLKREQTQPNAGSVRSTGRLTQAQRPTAKPAGGAAMLANSTQRIANPRVVPASFVKDIKPKASGKTYTVKPGDSLERIARKQLGSGKQWKSLASLNGITNPDMVRIGDVLQLPVPQAGVASNSSGGSKARLASRSDPAPTAGAGKYTVAKGDVLSRIAERQLGSSKRWREIVALNSGLNPSRLMVGTVLNMPAGAKSKPVGVPVDATYLARAGSSRSKPARFVVE